MQFPIPFQDYLKNGILHIETRQNVTFIDLPPLHWVTPPARGDAFALELVALGATNSLARMHVLKTITKGGFMASDSWGKRASLETTGTNNFIPLNCNDKPLEGCWFEFQYPFLT